MDTKDVVNSTGNVVTSFSKASKFVGKTVEAFGMFQGIYGNIDALQLQRNYMWDVILPDFGEISTRVLAIDFAGAEFVTVDSMNMGPRLRKEPGKYQVPNIRLSMLEDEFGSVWDYMLNWWKAILPDGNSYSPQKVYKENLSFNLLSTYGVKRKEFKAKGCFPVAQPIYNMSYGDNKVTVVDVRLSVDDIESPEDNNIGLGALKSFFKHFK